MILAPRRRVVRIALLVLSLCCFGTVSKGALVLLNVNIHPHLAQEELKQGGFANDLSTTIHISEDDFLTTDFVDGGAATASATAVFAESSVFAGGTGPKSHATSTGLGLRLSNFANLHNPPPSATGPLDPTTLEYSSSYSLWEVEVKHTAYSLISPNGYSSSADAILSVASLTYYNLNSQGGQFFADNTTHGTLLVMRNMANGEYGIAGSAGIFADHIDKFNGQGGETSFLAPFTLFSEHIGPDLVYPAQEIRLNPFVRAATYNGGGRSDISIALNWKEPKPQLFGRYRVVAAAAADGAFPLVDQYIDIPYSDLGINVEYSIAVPEPGTSLLLLIGAVLLAGYRVPRMLKARLQNA